MSYDPDFIPDEAPAAPSGGKYHPDFVPDDAPSSGAMEMAKTGVRAGAKVLDYQRGAGAVGLDRVARALGLPQGMSDDQASAALDPRTPQTAPSYRDLLKNWGAPAGPSTQDIPTKAGILGVIARHLPTVTARDAVGTGMDMGLDPLAYEGGALERGAEALHGIPVAGRAARAAADMPSVISDQAKEGAAHLYESGIPAIVKAGKAAGNPDVATTMLEHRISGTPAQIQAGMQDAASARKTFKDTILSEAGAAGATASKDAAITPVFEQLRQMIKDQRITPDQGSRILQDLTESKMRGGDGVAPALMDTWKTDERAALPGNTYNEVRMSRPPLAKQLRQALGSGYQNEVENSIGKTFGEPVEDIFSDNNAKLGDLINRKVQKAAADTATRYDASPWLTKSEMLTGLGLGGAGAAMGHTAGYTAEGGLGILGTLAAIKAANSPVTRTVVGDLATRALNAPGVSPLLDAASRRAIVDPTRKSPYVIPAKPKASE